MSKDKYSNIFPRRMEVFLFLNVQTFFATCAYLKIRKYHWDIPKFWLRNIQSRDAFNPIAHERKYSKAFKRQYGDK